MGSEERGGWTFYLFSGEKRGGKLIPEKML